VKYITKSKMYVKISDEKIKRLKQKMEKLGMRESDLEEKFIKSSGPGGQKINKTSSCVYLKHKPAGIEVKCCQSRYQSVNRFLARRLLTEKIESVFYGKPAEKE